MMQRIASLPELPELVEQELAHAPGAVFDIPSREIDRYSTNVRRMHQDLIAALEWEKR
jgi:hypothetical protein